MNWINPAGGDWDTASNWVNSANPSDQHVPTDSDNAVIDLPDITVTHDSGADAVNSITSQDPIALNGGTLTIASASTINSSLTVAYNSLTSSGGTLGVNGPLAVNGTFSLGARTTLTGSGTVDAYGGLNMSNGDGSILGVTLNNHDAATWEVDGRGVTLSDGAVFNNLAGATFSAVGSSGVLVQGNGSFNNAGTFTASTAVGGDVNIGPAFFNTGTVVLTGGELDLSGDGATPNTGTFTGTARTSLNLYDEVLAPSSVICSAGTVGLNLCTEAGSFSAAGDTFADDSSFTGPVLGVGTSLEISNTNGTGLSVRFAPAVGGPVKLTAGTLTIDPSATLTGTDSFGVNGLLTLSAGSQLSVSGTLDANGGMDLGGDVVIQGTTLNNHGAATWNGDIGDDSLSGGAVINNVVGATFVASGRNSIGIGAGDGSAVAFNNFGIFISSTAPGYQVAVTVPFVNTGLVVDRQGKLSLSGDGAAPSAGSFTAAAGTGLSLSDLVLAAGSVVSSDGFVSVTGCTLAGSFRAAGGTYAESSNFTGPVLDLGSSLEIYGTAAFAPAVGGPVTLTTGALTFDPNSVLTGTDNFVADGLLTLGPNSQLSVAGSVDGDGGLTLSDGTITIQGTTLNNYGTATWDLGPLANVLLDAGANINNMAGATFATVGANNGVNNIQDGDSSAVAFDNAGTFTSSAPTGVNIKVLFVNTGSMVVQQGDLNIPNFTNSGTLSVDPGASFNGSGSLQSPIVVSTGNTLTTTPGETLTTSVILAGGTLDVTGQLTLDGTLAFANGSMLEGAGPVDAFGGVSIEGNVAISATTLNNYGAATWDQTAIFGPESIVTLSSGAVINNLEGATLTTDGDLGNPNGAPGGEIIAGDSSAVAFNNAGTFLCQQGSEGGATSIAVPFTQTSTGATVVQGQLAALSLDGESTIAGSMVAAAGATYLPRWGNRQRVALWGGSVAHRLLWVVVHLGCSVDRHQRWDRVLPTNHCGHGRRDL